MHKYSRRRGDDVWLPARAAAAWLHGRLQFVEQDKNIRIWRGQRWVEAIVGSRYLVTQDKQLSQSMPFDCSEESCRDSDNEACDADEPPTPMLSLRSVVAAFGGTYRYDSSANQVAIHLP